MLDHPSSKSTLRTKRRQPRASTACKPCKVKKIKCSGSPPPCNRCQASGSECTFDERTRKLTRAQRNESQISYLEQRVVRLEETLASVKESRAESLLSTDDLGLISKLGLPSTDDVYDLIQEYFDNFNSYFPIYNPSDFYKRIHEGRSKKITEDKALFVSVSTAVSLAYRIRAIQAAGNNEAERCNKVSSILLDQGLEIWDDLFSSPFSLQNVQAILGIIVLLQGTPRLSMASDKASLVLQMATAVCFRTGDDGLPTFEDPDTQALRVFWLAKLVDQDFTYLFNRTTPANTITAQLNAPVPESQNGFGLIPSSRLGCSVPFFELRICMARVQRSIQCELYSPISLTECASTRSLKRDCLIRLLENLLTKVPFELNYESVMMHVGPESMLHMTVFYLFYFQTLIMAYGLSIQNDSWRSRILCAIQKGRGDCLFKAEEYCCVRVARDSLLMLQPFQRGHDSLFWHLLIPWISSLLVFLGGIAQGIYPNSSNENLEIARGFVRLLDCLAKESGLEDVKRMYRLCLHLERYATKSVENAETQRTRGEAQGWSVGP